MNYNSRKELLEEASQLEAALAATNDTINQALKALQEEWDSFDMAAETIYRNLRMWTGRLSEATWDAEALCGRLEVNAGFLEVTDEP